MKPPLHSIRRRLLAWLFTGFALAIAGAAVATYLRARDEANALFDYQLKEMAASLTGAPFAPPQSFRGAAGSNAGALVVQIWDRNGVQLYLSQPRRELPQNAQLGFSTVRTDGGDWRVFSSLAEGQVVQVAQPMTARRELAASMALRTLVPLLFVMPLLALIIWLTIARGMEPLARVASAVSRRSPAALEPLSERGLPVEVVPLVHALNGLLDRLDHALDAQRAFIADAAHELRTPLTAVHLQAQLAERAPTEDARRLALEQLKAGLDRITRLTEQLLTLAREEPSVALSSMHSLDLRPLAREVVEALSSIAAARNVDLGLVAAADDGTVPSSFTVNGDGDALRALVTNLVDNAVRYAPAGGRVDVSVASQHGRVTLAVRDNGPGIPESERERVFDRFYRGASSSAAPGSGLGLAIVKTVAERHGASVDMGPGLDGRGVGITVRFPRPEERAADDARERTEAAAAG